jgi:hypothetical protein
MNLKKLLENWQHYIEEAEHFDSENKNLSQVISSLEQLVQKPFIFYDTETLGLNPERDQIIQLGYSVYINNERVEELNMIASLNEDSERRFTPGTEENKRFMDRLNYEKANELAKLERNKKKITPEEYETKLKDIENKSRPDFIFNLTGYDPSTAQMTEKEMLVKFFEGINKYQNSTLCAHNIKFDLNGVNVRNKKYGLPTLDENQNIATFFDTLKLSKDTYLPTLKSLLDKLQKQLSELEKTVQKPKEVNTAISQVKGNIDNEFKKSDISSISKDIQNITSDFSDVDQKILSLKILIIGTSNALQNTKKVFSHTLGNLARTYKINPEKAHNAIEDVRMLVDVFNGMLNVLKIAQSYIGNEQETINEMINEIYSLRGL